MQIHGVFGEQHGLSALSALRASYDPIRAARFPLHITVSYAPERSLSELPRLEPSMALTLGEVRAWPAPESGIYLSAQSHGDWLSTLRADLVDRGSPDYQPHVTLLHHRAVSARQDLKELVAEFGRGWRPITLNLVSLVAVDENGVVLERISLS